jgi:phenylalanyl-tRNA synthetase alpha chain
MVELRENETRILAAIDKHNGKATVEALIAETELPDSAVMRAALILQENNLVQIHSEVKTLLKLTDEGESYARNGLPERQLVNSVIHQGGTANLNDAVRETSIEPDLAKVALGWTQRKKWATYNPQKNTLSVTQSPEEQDDEKLLQTVSTMGQISPYELSSVYQTNAEILKKRNLLIHETRTERTLELTTDARQLLYRQSTALGAEITLTKTVTQLRPENITTGEWRTLKLQPYNIQAPVAKTYGGKKHPYLAFLDEVRAKLVTLGFQEMTGTVVEAAFFNFDALYTPQDHPAREQDGIYYIKNTQPANLAQYKKTIQNVKATHENGDHTGSTGWQTTYTETEAKRLILRGHGTCLSARTLLHKDLQIPSKHFSIARVYRPEVVDKTHLSEFNQVEGIVIDKNLNLKDLLGVLGKFAKEIAGADKIRFKPDYFPFTEPSVELSAYKEGFGWVEFGGSGIFRPEVTLPLGIKEPVIAWGLGVDRLFMMRACIDDIRCIFSQNLDWLRKKEVT